MHRLRVLTWLLGSSTGVHPSMEAEPRSVPALPPLPTRPFLFISYASRDRANALSIASALRAAGTELWIDQTGIEGGTAYGAEIAAAIKDCRALLLLCSAASLASRNVRQEIMLAWRFERPILPLLLEPTSFPDDIAYWLEGAQWIEVFARPEQDWLPLVGRALARHGLAMSEIASAGAAVAHNDVEFAPNISTRLPDLDGPTFGREREIDELLALLAQGRWVTLTGPGGTGKTRLAIETARRAAPDYPGGAWFVDFAPITVARRILPELAAVLEIADEQGRPLLEALAERLSTRSLLLLDNMEQIPSAADELAPLMAAAPALTVLATSRVPVGAEEEWIYTVGQLPIPSPETQISVPLLAQNAAVRLFVDRAQAARRDFVLSEANARSVAEICMRLEGLPLAIELAAARTKLLPPSAILVRLGSRLNLLTRGAGRSRQSTLRGAIGWSYDLLSASERIAFRRLAVFVGGASVEAAETVLALEDGSQAPSIDDLFALVDHSLVRVEAADTDDARWLRMLESIREFANERLAAEEDSDRVRAAHAGYFLARAEELATELASPRPGPAFSQLRRDNENLRTALDWLESASRDHTNGTEALRMAVALTGFWRRLGYFTEARDHLAKALALATDAEPALRARGLERAGFMTARLGDLREAKEIIEQARAIWRQVGDRAGEVNTLRFIAELHEDLGEFAEARVLRENILSIHREQDDHIQTAIALHELGMLALYQGEYDVARENIADALTLYRRTADARNLATALNDLAITEMLTGDGDAAGHAAESVRLWRTLDDTYARANALGNLGRALQLAGRYRDAISPLRESLETAMEIGDSGAVGLARYGLGLVALGTDDLDAAATELSESLRQAQVAQAPWHIAERLEAIAAVWLARQDPERAAGLLAGAAALRERGRFPVPPAERAGLDRTQTAIETVLGPTAAKDAAQAGRALSVDALVALALGTSIAQADH